MTPSPSHAPSIQEEPPLSDPETNLAEIAAPPPIYDRSEKATRHEQYLENQRSQYKQSEGDPEQPVATENHHEKSTVRLSQSELLRMTYIVSYLILFSSVVTMLRMVIGSLTFILARQSTRAFYEPM